MKHIFFLMVILLSISLAHSTPKKIGKNIQVQQKGILISDAYIMGRKHTSTGAFLTLTNTTDKDDVLQGIKQNPNFASRLEIHITKTHNGMATMQQVASLPIAKQQTVYLQQGGYHIMIMGLKHPLHPNRLYPLTLQFKHAGDITIQMPVKRMRHIRNKNTDENSHKDT